MSVINKQVHQHIFICFEYLYMHNEMLLNKTVQPRTIESNALCDGNKRIL